MFPGRPGLPVSPVKYSLNVSADEFAIHRTGRSLYFDSSYYEIVPGWSASLPFLDYGRVARHSGATVTVSLRAVRDHPLSHRAARMDASDWNHWSGICVSVSVSKVSRFRLGSGEDS